MPFDLFGFRITREKNKNLNAVVPPSDTDGAQLININSETGAGFGHYSYNYNLDFIANNEISLINKYREIALYSEVENAIDEIVNESISTGDGFSPVDINLENVNFSANIKEKIRNEFDKMLTMLNFYNNSYEIFKRWYIDGRLYYQVVIDKTDPQQGIQEISYIDPRTIKKIKEVRTKKNANGVDIIDDIEEYFVYKPNISTQNILRLPIDSVAEATSGIIDESNGQTMTLSFLHKAIKPLNQLRSLEDATVIYRLARAPERRIFYVDVGQLPKGKAEQYVESIMNKYRNKITYDSTTGEVRDDKKTMAMLEDFWMPRREGGRGTEITNLPAGQNLGELTDVKYFQRKMYKSLNVPVGRLESESATLSSGRATEISREEIKFAKFIQRLRTRFTNIFDDLLGKQLILKKIVTLEEWENDIKPKLFYDFKVDNHFLEFNEAEIQTRRMEVAQTAASMGKDFYSNTYIRKKFLKQTDSEIEQIMIDNGIEPPVSGEDGEAIPGVFGTSMPTFIPGEETPIETPEEPEAEITPATPSPEPGIPTPGANAGVTAGG